MEMKLQIAIASIRQLRNAYRPVNTLPLEILSNVLHKAQPDSPSFMPPFSTGDMAKHIDVGPYEYLGWDSPQDRLPPPRADISDASQCFWMTLSSVCRRWRDAFDASPTLWSRIDGASHLATFLKRSGNTPLTVHFGMRTPTPFVTQSDLVQIAHHSSRLTQLHLDVTEYEGTTSFDEILSHPVPCLSSLTVKKWGLGNAVWWTPATPSTVFPSLFNNEMPRLRQLSLSYYTSWPRGYFRNLSHLLLFDQSHTGRPTTSMFLDFLEASPLLEELALVNAGPTLDDEHDVPAASPYRSVSLLHLRELNIGDWLHASTISRLLSHLHLPSTASLHIWGHSHTNHADISSFIPADAFGLANLSTITEWQFVRIRPQDLNHPDFSRYNRGPQNVRLYISIIKSILYMYGPFQDHDILTIPSRFSLDAVRNLTIVDSVPHTGSHILSGTWAVLFQHLPSLASIRIVSLTAKHQVSVNATREIVSALCLPDRPFDAGLEDELEPVIRPCPILETLIIEEETSMPTLQIFALAEERARTEHPIQKLKISFTEVSRPQAPPPHAAGWANDPWSNGPHSTPSDPSPMLTALSATDVSFLKRHIAEVVVNRRESRVARSLTEYGPLKWSNRVLAWSRGLPYHI